MKRLTFQDLLLIFYPLVIYFPSFRYFFFQDDFLHLRNSFIKDFLGFLAFFKPQAEAIYYRPLSLEIYFYLTRILFGLNPWVFRLIAFLFFILSIFFLKKLIKKITGDDFLALIVAFLFGISSVHFMSIFWICEFSVILGSFFLFLSFLYYPQKKAFFFFALGLLSHELVIILPFLLFFYERLFKKSNSKIFISFLALSLFYLISRFIIFPMPLEESYELAFGKNSLNVFLWYLLWAFNLPEELRYQSVLSRLTIRKEFLASFLPESIIWLLNLSIFIILFFILPIIFKKKLSLKRKTKRILIFAIIWSIVGIFPLILTPGHQYPLYLAFFLPGFYLLLVVLFFSYSGNFKYKRRKILLFFLMAAFFLNSLMTIRFTELTHWTVQEAKRAKRYLKKARESRIIGETEFLLVDNDQVRVDLNNQDAFKVFFGEEVEVLFIDGETFKKYKKDLGNFQLVEI